MAVGSFFALTILSWALSTDPDQSLYGERLQYQGLLTTMLYVGFYCLARLAFPYPARLLGLRAAVSAGAILVAAYAVLQKSGHDPVWDGFLPGARVFSSIGQANALAAYLVLALPLTASLVFATSKAGRWRQRS